MPSLLRHILGVSVVVIPFLTLLIWAVRRQRREVAAQHRRLERLADALAGGKRPDAFEVRFELRGALYAAGIGGGGESDPDMLYVGRAQAPLPDGITFVFARGINRRLSRKLHTGDRRFDASVSYQTHAFQKRHDRNELAERLCNDADVRAALLHIRKAGYSHVWIPGSWKRDSTLDSLAQTFVQATRLLMAYANNPAPRHYAPEKVRRIAEALAVIATRVDTVVAGQECREGSP